MGHHYLPRRLLKNFSVIDLIWMFDKTGKQPPKQLPIARVAQEPGMYPQPLEERLTNEIEQPFNLVLEKIAHGGGIKVGDREALAKYVITTYRRVPNGRERSRTAFPEVANAVKQATLAEIDLLQSLSPNDRELAASGRKNVESIFSRLKADDPEWIWHETLLPDRFKMLLPVLCNMSWKVASAPAGKQFILGDAPVLFDEQLGLGSPRAILVMPISSSSAIVATHGHHIEGEHRVLIAQQVHAINAESASKAQRWIFALRDEKWISALCEYR